MTTAHSPGRMIDEDMIDIDDFITWFSICSIVGVEELLSALLNTGKQSVGGAGPAKGAQLAVAQCIAVLAR